MQTTDPTREVFEKWGPEIYMTADEGIKHREVVQEAKSADLRENGAEVEKMKINYWIGVKNVASTHSNRSRSKW